MEIKKRKWAHALDVVKDNCPEFYAGSELNKLVAGKFQSQVVLKSVSPTFVNTNRMNRDAKRVHKMLRRQFPFSEYTITREKVGTDTFILTVRRGWGENKP